MKQIFVYLIFFCFSSFKCDLCGENPCFKKCCQRGLALTFEENFICNYTDSTNLNVSLLPHQEDLKSYFDVIESEETAYDLNCPDGTVQMFLSPYEDDFYLHESGNVFVTADYIIKSFCGDVFNGENGIFYCAWMETKDFRLIGMIISMPFLIATFLVYALLPDKNLPAKSLMCYVLSLLFAYIMLVTIQLNSHLDAVACVTIAYLCYFFFMASFFWMNSSCIDIWLTFSGIKGITGQRTQERKRFIYYCLYSWGLPLIMTSIVIVMTMEVSKESVFFTGIGDGQCWFKNGLPTGIYFYFPIAILLITNIVLFAITALKIRNVQRDTKVLTTKDSSKHEKDKQRFNLYIKLLFAMGVNWSMEVISWVVQWKSDSLPAYIWYITDFCNAMYGVLIFFIFVFKKNIWIMLKKRYLQIMGRSTRAHSMGTSTHRTTVSQVTSSEA